MAIHVKKLPPVQTYPLSLDPTGEATVTFRQARRGETERLAESFSKYTLSYEDPDAGTVRRTQEWNVRKIEQKQVFLTLVGAEGLFIENPDGSTAPLFRFRETSDGIPMLAMTEVQFDKAWALLDEDLAEEIILLCHKHNPHWGRQGED